MAMTVISSFDNCGAERSSSGETRLPGTSSRPSIQPGPVRRGIGVELPVLQSDARASRAEEQKTASLFPMPCEEFCRNGETGGNPAAAGLTA
jgi:hypothetical protein